VRNRLQPACDRSAARLRRAIGSRRRSAGLAGPFPSDRRAPPFGRMNPQRPDRPGARGSLGNCGYGALRQRRANEARSWLTLDRVARPFGSGRPSEAPSAHKIREGTVLAPLRPAPVLDLTAPRVCGSWLVRGMDWRKLANGTQKMRNYDIFRLLTHRGQVA
jgi:hypothetical protein